MRKLQKNCSSCSRQVLIYVFFILLMRLAGKRRFFFSKVIPVGFMEFHIVRECGLVLYFQEEHQRRTAAEIPFGILFFLSMPTALLNSFSLFITGRSGGMDF